MIDTGAGTDPRSVPVPDPDPAAAAALAQGLASSESAAFCLAISALFVFSLYCVPARVRRLGRDHPTHVKYRLCFSSIATSIAIVMAYPLRHQFPHGSVAFLPSIGIRADNLALSVGVTVLLMTVFYTGPLVVCVARLLVETHSFVSYQGRLSDRARPQSFMEAWLTRARCALASEPEVILLRNLVVAPLTEEVVFRGLMVPALFSSCCLLGTGIEGTAAYISVRAPAFFGVAHAHHLYEKIRVNRESPVSALLSTLVQLTYTSIFGAIACYLLIRTGNLAAPVASHMICNFMGLPDVSFLQPNTALGFLHPYRFALLALHALGLVAFWLLLDPLTSSAQCVGQSPFWT